MTLEGRKVLKEGWLTLFKSRKTGIFNSKPAPNKQLERGWAVIYGVSPGKTPSIAFYMDNRKEKPVMKRERIDLSAVRGISRMFDHPKHPHCFVLKMKGSKQLILNADSAHDVEIWLKIVCEITRLEYKREKVIWEYYDGGLWNALPDGDSYHIEGRYCEGVTGFQLEDSQGAFSYNLHTLHRTHLRTRAVHRIKRTPFIEERPEVYHSKMTDLPALWEWGDEHKNIWHPFERETNIQIEDMYDSGSQWAELTLCLPSPMPFLLDLHDMKLVNFRTAVRFNLRRIDNSENIQEIPTCPQARSPSPDDFDQPPPPNMMSPMGPMFRPLQECLQHLQVPRSNITYKNMLGEGAFGEVFLSTVVGLPGVGEHPAEVAVKQLRLSDFIARHGHHTQQMEDFLREAKEMSKVDHHRVVKLLAVCTLDYPLLLIEEYMNQGDLLGVLKDSRPSMPTLTQLTFAQHVADGMDYIANILNTVHRDLAARNILVHKHTDGSMQAKVADFGLSRHLYSEMYKTQGSKPRPLPAKWMALESLMYFIFTSKSDVWSYGVMLWEIMTLGRSPYPGVENRELLEQIEEKGLKLTRPKPCPTAVYEMILECTQHDPDNRPTFPDLRSRLEVCLQQLENGELVMNGGESAPTSPKVTSPSTSAPTDAVDGATPTNTPTEGDVVKSIAEKEAVKKKEEEEEEWVAGHVYTTVNKVNRKPKAKTPEDTDPQSPSKSSSSSETTPTGDTPPAAAEGSGDMQTQEVTMSFNGVSESPRKKSKPRQEVTEMGHLYYLLDPRDEPPPSQLPPPTSSVPPPLPSLKSRSHSSSPLPNNHSPAHQSANPAHSGENSPSHPRAHSMSSKTDQAGVNKSSDLVVTSQEAR